MQSGLRSAHLLPAFLGASLVVVTANATIAADASAWDNDIRSAARLIAASAAGKPAVLRAGIEIKLEPGWKTYWRYPGDSGVPPVFDFSESENVANATVLFPAPARFDDGAGGKSIGYKGGVVLPLHVTPRDAGRPVVLRMKLDYAACEKLCVPAKASAELRLAATGNAHDGTLRGAEARVPRRVAIGDPGALAFRAVARDAGSGKPRVIVDLAARSGASVDMFAEGPTADWALPLPEPVKDAPAGLRRFAFELDGLPPGVSASGATLLLTAVAGDRAIETSFRLD